MTTLSEIENYLKDLDITKSRIKLCYDIIPNKERRVDDADEMWVACATQDHENDTAYKAIKKIINTYDSTISNEDIKNSRDRVCKQFKKVKIKNKHRIPFYILMLDKLI